MKCLLLFTSNLHAAQHQRVNVPYMIDVSHVIRANAKSIFLSMMMIVFVFSLFFASKALSTEGTNLPQLIPSPPDETSTALSLYPQWWDAAPKHDLSIPCKDPGSCVKCHEANSSMDPSHAVACISCHGGDSGTEEKEKAHKDLIADPGDLSTVDKTCGKCHPEEARRVKRSSMALAPRMISQTRFAFGAQKNPEAQYGTVEVDGLRQVPHPSQSENLGDDLLRRSCLRCHLYTKGSARWGEHRAKGCSACHVAYPNSTSGGPRFHALVRNSGINACLKCHNSNHVGSDFVGLFEKDFNRGFRSPFVEGRQPPRIYGSEQHRLNGDVHFRAGMGCMDCHTLDEVHGNGKINQLPINQVRISCEGCHVRGDHPAVLKSPEGEMTLLRGAGRRIPNWNPERIPHLVGVHREKLRCSACHSAWSFQDYGLHLMLEERPDYWKWSPNAAQNDPQVQDLLSRSVGTSVELVPPEGVSIAAQPQEQWQPPQTNDWLSGEARPGAWFRGYTVRRWSRPPLGLDHLGRVSVMRPIYQYVISHVDSHDNLLLDRKVPMTGAGFPALIFNPYSPHTTSATGRACHECHGSAKAAGLGNGISGIEKPGFHSLLLTENRVPGLSFRWDALVDDKGNALQRSTTPRAGPLDPSTFAKLLNPSQLHRATWYRYLKEYGLTHP